jgi:hypothetical protein
MIDVGIEFPTQYHKQYLESLYDYCNKKELSLILKGSLAKGTAKEFSDIDVIIMGNLVESEIDNIITIYGNPVMTNFTERPKGILILNYENSISVDLDLRKTVTQEELGNSKILLKFHSNFLNCNETVRQKVHSVYMPERPDWYKTLRLVHRAIIKYLSGNLKSANDLLLEIKQNLDSIDIKDLKMTGKFECDIVAIFDAIWINHNFDLRIKRLFELLLREF